MAKNKYKGKLATDAISENKVKFSREALDDLATQNNVPVTYAGTVKPIGVTRKISLEEDGSVSVLVDMFITPMELLGLYVVPEGIVNPEDIDIDKDGIKTIKRFALMGVMLTPQPADISLDPIEETDEGETK